MSDPSTELDLEQLRAGADALVSEVRRAYVAGLVRVGFSPDYAARLLSLGPLGLVTEWGRTPTMLAVDKNMRDLQPRIGDLAGRYRRWAELGHREDGSAYSWERWSQYGRELLDAIAYQTGIAWDSSVIVNLARASKETGATIAAVVDPRNWPSWVPWALGGAGVLAVLFVLTPYLGRKG